jgi:hypothetical protein
MDREAHTKLSRDFDYFLIGRILGAIEQLAEDMMLLFQERDRTWIVILDTMIALPVPRLIFSHRDFLSCLPRPTARSNREFRRPVGPNRRKLSSVSFMPEKICPEWRRRGWSFVRYESEMMCRNDLGAIMAQTADTHPLSYVDAPMMLLFGDSPAGLRSSEYAARAAGGRVGVALPIEEAADRLEEQASVELVIVHVAADHGELLDALLDQLDDAASAGRFASVVMLVPDLIDIVAARVHHDDVTLLCEPNEIEQTAAIGMALASRRAKLNDIGSDSGTIRLKQLSEEVGRIARTLASLSDADTSRGENGFIGLADRRKGFTTSPSVIGDAAMVRSIIRARRLRDQFFQAELFADPAWDMLLDLMAARLERRAVAVSSLCIAAAVPPTTALRWIKTMTDAGLFLRVADPRDGRRVFIELSHAAAEGMAAYLTSIRNMATIAS